MSVSIFDELCRDRGKILSLVESRDEAVLRPLTDEELNNIDALAFSEVSHRVGPSWAMESKVCIPQDAQLLTTLGESEQGHTVLLYEDGTVKQNLTIPPGDGWAVEMLGFLGEESREGADVAGLSRKYGVEPGKLAQILEYLRIKGFVELV